MTSHPSLVLLNRHLSLKELSPFTLIIDTLAQSSSALISEYVYRSNAPVVYLSFETSGKPSYASEYLDCHGKSTQEVKDFVDTATSPNGPKRGSADGISARRALVIVDSLNYVPVEKVSAFVTTLVSPNHAVIGCFHGGVPVARGSGPSALQLLQFIAQSTFEVEPLRAVEDSEALESQMAQLRFPSGLNSPVFKLSLSNKKKSGKSLSYVYVVDSEKHHYDVYQPKKEETDADDVLEGLTTFNLNTSSKQKLAREQVELPFMEAQAELGKYGGAIVYEFEKDDDYDEEDPYEDPF